LGFILDIPPARVLALGSARRSCERLGLRAGVALSRGDDPASR
jgi:hypothetical protein